MIHRHKCRRCGAVWSHDTWCVPTVAGAGMAIAGSVWEVSWCFLVAPVVSATGLFFYAAALRRLAFDPRDR